MEVYTIENGTDLTESYISATGSNASFDNEYILDKLNDKALKRQLPAIVYTAIMMLLGLPGNMVVFYVYFFKWRQSTSRIFILGIAILDMINCATTLPMEIFIMRNSQKLDKPFLCKITRFSTYAMNSASATILVGIAVDRFIHICRPHSKSFSARTSLYICIGSVVSAIVFTWPSLILYGTRILHFGSITGYACQIQNIYDRTPYPLIYLSVMMLVTIILFIILAVFYCLIGMQIYKHRQAKKKKCTHIKKSVNGEPIIEPDSGSHYKLAKQTPDNNENNAIENTNEGKGTNGMVLENKLVKVIDNEQGKHDESETIQNYDIQVDATDRHNVGNETIHKEDEIQTGDKEQSELLDSVKDLEKFNKTKEEDNPFVRTSPKRLISSTSSSSGGQRSSQTERSSGNTTRMSVKYLLVRGASSFRRSSERNKCTKCVTVRIGRSTLMLFLITIAYVLSFIPFYMIVILRQSDKAFVQNLSEGAYMAYNLFLRSYLLSSAINPFIYSFCNAQFREYCKDLFLHVILRRPQSQTMQKLQRRF